MTKIAIHLHLYYLEQLDDILQRLSYLDGCKYDLFVTMSELNPQAYEKILKFNPNAIIWQTPNLGYDFGPFIDFLHKINLDNYDYVLKIHTKRTSNNCCLFKHRRFSIKTWRDMLIDSVLNSAQAVQNNLQIMAENPHIGMIGSDYVLTDDKECLLQSEMLSEEMQKIGLTMPDDLHFVAGTMFLARAKLLKPFLKYQITDFATSAKNVHDNTLAHVLERLFGLAVSAQGYEIRGVHYKSFNLMFVKTAVLRFLFQKKITRKGKFIIKIFKIPVFIAKTYPDSCFKEVVIYKVKRLMIVISRLLGFIDKKSSRREVMKLKVQYLSRRSYKKGIGLANNGIGISLDVAGANSLAEVGRDLIDKLKQTDIPFAVFDTKVSGDISQSKWKIASSYTEQISDFLPYKKKILCMVGECYKEPEYDNIITPFWEFESGMPEVYPNLFENVYGVIAFSDFCYKYFKTIIPQNVKLYKVKYPFVKNWQITEKPEDVRKKYDINADDFVVYFAFDYNSCYERKNPEAVVEAFTQAFKDNQKAKLVIKTNGFEQHPDKVKKLQDYVAERGVEKQTVFINSFLTRNQIMELMNACNVFISLHRGEGLGLGMLEAMSLAKPVIATNFGGNTEFMNKDNSFLIDYDYIKPQISDFKTYAFVKEWANPNIAQATDCLKYVCNNPKQAEELGQKAQRFVFEYYNTNDFANEILKILEEQQ